jgi:hypothetical protein
MAFTGALMAAVDLDTFLQSRLYWIKMASVASLLTDGALLVAAERAARRRNGESRLGPPAGEVRGEPRALARDAARRHLVDGRRMR